MGTSGSRAVTVTNATPGVALHVQLTGAPGFRPVPHAFVLAAGERREVAVAFQPGRLGPFNDALSVCASHVPEHRLRPSSWGVLSHTPLADELLDDSAGGPGAAASAGDAGDARERTAHHKRSARHMARTYSTVTAWAHTAAIRSNAAHAASDAEGSASSDSDTESLAASGSSTLSRHPSARSVALHRTHSSRKAGPVPRSAREPIRLLAQVVPLLGLPVHEAGGGGSPLPTSAGAGGPLLVVPLRVTGSCCSAVSSSPTMDQGTAHVRGDATPWALDRSLAAAATSDAHASVDTVVGGVSVVPLDGGRQPAPSVFSSSTRGTAAAVQCEGGVASMLAALTATSSGGGGGAAARSRQPLMSIGGGAVAPTSMRLLLSHAERGGLPPLCSATSTPPPSPPNGSPPPATTCPAPLPLALGRTGALLALAAVASERRLTSPSDRPHENASYTGTVAELACRAHHKRQYGEFLRHAAEERLSRVTAAAGGGGPQHNVSDEFKCAVTRARARAASSSHGSSPPRLRTDTQPPPAGFVAREPPLNEGVGAVRHDCQPRSAAAGAQAASELSEAQAALLLTAPSELLDFGGVHLTHAASRAWFVHNRSPLHVRVALLLHEAHGVGCEGLALVADPLHDGSGRRGGDGCGCSSVHGGTVCGSQVIPPRGKARFTLRFQPQTAGPLECVLPFRINGRYTHSLRVAGRGCAISVSVSDRRLHLAFPPTSTEPSVRRHVQLTNNAIVPAHYRWVHQHPGGHDSASAAPAAPVHQVPTADAETAAANEPRSLPPASASPGGFRMHPESGVLAPGAIVTVAASYTPTVGCACDCAMTLVVDGDGGGAHGAAGSLTPPISHHVPPLAHQSSMPPAAAGRALQTVRLHGDPFLGEVTWGGGCSAVVGGALIFGAVAIGNERSAVVPVHNAGAGPVACWVHVAALPRGLAVPPPTEWVIPPGGSVDVTLVLCSAQPVTLDPAQHAVELCVRGGAPVRLPVGAAVVVPALSVRETGSHFDFGAVTIGSSAHRRVTLVNDSDVSVDVEVDLSSLPEVSLAPPPDHSLAPSGGAGGWRGTHAGGAGHGGGGGGGAADGASSAVSSLIRLDYDRESLISESRSRPGSRGTTAGGSGGVGGAVRPGSSGSAARLRAPPSAGSRRGSIATSADGDAVTLRASPHPDAAGGAVGGRGKAAIAGGAGGRLLRRPASGTSRGSSSGGGAGCASGTTTTRSSRGSSTISSIGRPGSAGRAGLYSRGDDAPLREGDDDGRNDEASDADDADAVALDSELVLDEAQAASRAAAEQFAHLPRRFRLKIKPHSAIECELIFCPRGEASVSFVLPLALSGALSTGEGKQQPQRMHPLALLPGLVRHVTARGSRPKLLLDPPGNCVDFQYRVLADDPAHRVPYQRSLLLRNVDSRPLQWAVDTSLLSAAQYAFPPPPQPRSLAGGEPGAGAVPALTSPAEPRFARRATSASLTSSRSSSVSRSESTGEAVGGDPAAAMGVPAAELAGSGDSSCARSRSLVCGARPAGRVPRPVLLARASSTATNASFDGGQGASSPAPLSCVRARAASRGAGSTLSAAATPTSPGGTASICSTPEKLSAPAVFTVTPSNGTLAPGASARIAVSFSPPGLREVSATLPLFARELPRSPLAARRRTLESLPVSSEAVGDAATGASAAGDGCAGLLLPEELTSLFEAQPYMELTVRGCGVQPQLSFDRPRLDLPPVDLGVTASGRFTVFNHGYDYLQLHARVSIRALSGHPDPPPVPLPPGPCAAGGQPPAADVELAAAVARAAACFTTSFPDGGLLSLARGSARVCVSFVSRAPISVVASIELVAGAAQDSSAGASYQREPPDGVVVSRFTVSATSDACTLTTQTQAQLQQHALAVCSGEVGACSRGSSTLLPGYQQQLLCAANALLLARRPVARVPADLIASHGEPLFDALALLSGCRVLPTRLPQRLPRGLLRRERVAALLERYRWLLAWLRGRGGLVCAVAPAQLLDRDDYCYVALHVDAQGDRGGGAPPPASSSSSLRQQLELERCAISPMLVYPTPAVKAEAARGHVRSHEAVATFAWGTLLLQVVRLLVLPRVTLRAVLGTPGVQLHPQHAAYREWLTQRGALLAEQLAARDPTRPDAKPQGGSQRSRRGTARQSSGGSTGTAADEGCCSDPGHLATRRPGAVVPCTGAAAAPPPLTVDLTCWSYSELAREARAVDGLLEAHFDSASGVPSAAASSASTRGTKTPSAPGASAASGQLALLRWISHHCHCALASGCVPPHEPLSVLPSSESGLRLTALGSGVHFLLTIASHAPDLAAPGGLLDSSRGHPGPRRSDAVLGADVPSSSHHRARTSSADAALGVEGGGFVDARERETRGAGVGASTAPMLPPMWLAPATPEQAADNLRLVECALQALHLDPPPHLCRQPPVGPSHHAVAGLLAAASSAQSYATAVAWGAAGQSASQGEEAVSTAATPVGVQLSFNSAGSPVLPTVPLLPALHGGFAISSHLDVASAGLRSLVPSSQSAADACEGDDSQYLLLALWLFNRLPQAVPRRVVDFSGAVGERIIRTITVRAALSGPSVAYGVILEHWPSGHAGGSSGASSSEELEPPFTLVHECGEGQTGSPLALVLAAGGSACVTIACTPRVTRSVHAKLILVPMPPVQLRPASAPPGATNAAAAGAGASRSVGCAIATPPTLVYALRSVVTSRQPVTVKHLSCELYSATSVDVDVPCPLRTDSLYDVRLLLHPDDEEADSDGVVAAWRGSNLTGPAPTDNSELSCSAADAQWPSPYMPRKAVGGALPALLPPVSPLRGTGVVGGVGDGSVSTTHMPSLPSSLWCRHANSVVALHPGHSKRLTVHFQPLRPGSRHGTLLLTDQRGRAEVAILLQATATVPPSARSLAAHAPVVLAASAAAGASIPQAAAASAQQLRAGSKFVAPHAALAPSVVAPTLECVVDPALPSLASHTGSIHSASRGTGALSASTSGTGSVPASLPLLLRLRVPLLNAAHHSAVVSLLDSRLPRSDRHAAQSLREAAERDAAAMRVRRLSELAAAAVLAPSTFSAAGGDAAVRHVQAVVPSHSSGSFSAAPRVLGELGGLFRVAVDSPHFQAPSHVFVAHPLAAFKESELHAAIQALALGGRSNTSALPAGCDGSAAAASASHVHPVPGAPGCSLMSSCAAEGGRPSSHYDLHATPHQHAAYHHLPLTHLCRAALQSIPAPESHGGEALTAASGVFQLPPSVALSRPVATALHAAARGPQRRLGAADGASSSPQPSRLGADDTIAVVDTAGRLTQAGARGLLSALAAALAGAHTAGAGGGEGLDAVAATHALQSFASLPVRLRSAGPGRYPCTVTLRRVPLFAGSGCGDGAYAATLADSEEEVRTYHLEVVVPAPAVGLQSVSFETSVGSPLTQLLPLTNRSNRPWAFRAVLEVVNSTALVAPSSSSSSSTFATRPALAPAIAPCMGSTAHIGLLSTHHFYCPAKLHVPPGETASLAVTFEPIVASTQVVVLRLRPLVDSDGGEGTVSRPGSAAAASSSIASARRAGRPSGGPAAASTPAAAAAAAASPLSSSSGGGFAAADATAHPPGFTFQLTGVADDASGLLPASTVLLRGGSGGGSDGDGAFVLVANPHPVPALVAAVFVGDVHAVLSGAPSITVPAAVPRVAADELAVGSYVPTVAATARFAVSCAPLTDIDLASSMGDEAARLELTDMITGRVTVHTLQLQRQPPPVAATLTADTMPPGPTAAAAHMLSAPAHMPPSPVAAPMCAGARRASMLHFAAVTTRPRPVDTPASLVEESVESACDHLSSSSFEAARAVAGCGSRSDAATTTPLYSAEASTTVVTGEVGSVATCAVVFNNHSLSPLECTYTLQQEQQQAGGGELVGRGEDGGCMFSLAPAGDDVVGSVALTVPPGGALAIPITVLPRSAGVHTAAVHVTAVRGPTGSSSSSSSSSVTLLPVVCNALPPLFRHHGGGSLVILATARRAADVTLRVPLPAAAVSGALRRRLLNDHIPLTVRIEPAAASSLHAVAGAADEAAAAADGDASVLLLSAVRVMGAHAASSASPHATEGGVGEMAAVVADVALRVEWGWPADVSAVMTLSAEEEGELLRVPVRLRVHPPPWEPRLLTLEGLPHAPGSALLPVPAADVVSAAFEAGSASELCARVVVVAAPPGAGGADGAAVEVTFAPTSYGGRRAEGVLAVVLRSGQWRHRVRGVVAGAR